MRYINWKDSRSCRPRLVAVPFTFGQQSLFVASIEVVLMQGKKAGSKKIHKTHAGQIHLCSTQRHEDPLKTPVGVLETATSLFPWPQRTNIRWVDAQGRTGAAKVPRALVVFNILKKRWWEQWKFELSTYPPTAAPLTCAASIDTI